MFDASLLVASRFPMVSKENIQASVLQIWRDVINESETQVAVDRTKSRFFVRQVARARSLEGTAGPTQAEVRSRVIEILTSDGPTGVFDLSIAVKVRFGSGTLDQIQQHVLAIWQKVMAQQDNQIMADRTGAFLFVV